MKRKRIYSIILTLLILCESLQSAYAKDDEREKYDRGEWIQQHMNYCISEQYKKEVVRGFGGCLYSVVSEVKNDKTIRKYSTLDSLNQVLDYDFDLSENEEYQLLLAQILFSYEGEKSIEEIYMQNITNIFIEMSEFIEKCDDIESIVDNEQLEKVVNLLDSAKDIEKMNEACDEFINFIDNEKLDKFLTKGFDETEFRNSIAINFLKEIRNGSIKTFKEIALYIAVGEAYMKTSDTFGNLLLSMRRNINIPSEQERFKPIGTNNLVSNENIFNLIKGDEIKYVDVLNTPVFLKDLATSLEEFYDSIEGYREEKCQKIVGIVTENFIDSAENFALETAKQTTDEILSCLPVFSRYEEIKKLFSTGQAIVDLFTSIDERQYLGNMILRLYCISYIEYLSLEVIAINKSGWNLGAINVQNEGKIIINDGKNTTKEELEEHQFELASMVDESVGVYKSISLVAIDYAKKYYSILKDEEEKKFFRSKSKIERYNEVLDELEKQKSEIKTICCHMANGKQSKEKEDITEIFSDYNVENASIYDIYQSAAEKNISSGNWREELEANGNMNLVSLDQKQKIKTKAILEAACNIENYDEKNLSALKISGNGRLQAVGEEIAWEVEYSKGVAHYTYIEPTNYTSDIVIDPTCFQFKTLTKEMMQDASMTGNRISFKVSGEQMEQVTSEAMNMMNGIENLKLGDGNVEISIDKERGIISDINILFQASMQYVGYQTDVDYDIAYHFIPSDGSDSLRQENGDGTWYGQFDKSKVPDGAGEFNGHYYYAFDLESITSWEDAKKYCEQLGGYLASVTSREEDEFLYSYLQAHFQYENAYFGFTDSEEEGIWKWSNGEESSYINWHEGEPNGENSEEDFAMYYYKYPDGSWNDGDFGNGTLNSGTVFVCEWGEYQIGRETALGEESVYSSVIEEYHQAFSDNVDYGYDELQEKYPYVNQSLVSFRFQGTKPFYGFYDIDGNGTEELFLGYETIEGYEYKIVDILTYDTISGEIKNIGDGEVFSAYAGSSVYDNGVIYNIKSDNIARFYRINSDGYHLELINSYTLVKNGEERCYSNNEEMLNGEEFDAMLRNQGNVVPYEWKELDAA